MTEKQALIKLCINIYTTDIKRFCHYITEKVEFLDLVEYYKIVSVASETHFFV